jgi:hypothetical protein
LVVNLLLSIVEGPLLQFLINNVFAIFIINVHLGLEWGGLSFRLVLNITADGNPMNDMGGYRSDCTKQVLCDGLGLLWHN